VRVFVTGVCDIETVGEFGGYASRNDAHAAAMRVQHAHRMMDRH
jgi:hypothetical protein